jgi:hypothetical protein
MTRTERAPPPRRRASFRRAGPGAAARPARRRPRWAGAPGRAGARAQSPAPRARMTTQLRDPASCPGPCNRAWPACESVSASDPGFSLRISKLQPWPARMRPVPLPCLIGSGASPKRKHPLCPTIMAAQTARRSLCVAQGGPGGRARGCPGARAPMRAPPTRPQPPPVGGGARARPGGAKSQCGEGQRVPSEKETRSQVQGEKRSSRQHADQGAGTR